MKYSIAVDFDGVIHSYTSPWVSAELIPDAPIPGAIAWLSEMVRHFNVIIFSARLTPHDNTEAGWAKAQDAKGAMLAWFRSHGMTPAVLGQLELWDKPGKPTALVYIDDRAYRFEGEFPSKDTIHRLRPWKVTNG